MAGTSGSPNRRGLFDGAQIFYAKEQVMDMLIEVIGQVIEAVVDAVDNAGSVLQGGPC